MKKKKKKAGKGCCMHICNISNEKLTLIKKRRKKEKREGHIIGCFFSESQNKRRMENGISQSLVKAGWETVGAYARRVPEKHVMELKGQVKFYYVDRIQVMGLTKKEVGRRDKTEALSGLPSTHTHTHTHSDAPPLKRPKREEGRHLVALLP
ncbi:hypothetical protein ACT7DE_13965 [Bacillus paranthracis]